MAERQQFWLRLCGLIPYVASAAGVYAFFVLTRSGQVIDAAALGATVVPMPLDWQLLLFEPLRRGLIVLLAVVTLVLGWAALRSGRRRLVAVTFMCSLLAVLLAEVLKGMLGRPDLGVATYEYGTWPSGHTAAGCALALACQRLLPENRWRPGRTAAATWLLIVLVTLVGYASVASYAHRPSDALGAILLTGAVFLGSVLPRAGRYKPRHLGASIIIPVAGSIALVLLAYSIGTDILRSLIAGAGLLALWAAATSVVRRPHPNGAYIQTARTSKRRIHPNNDAAAETSQVNGG